MNAIPKSSMTREEVQAMLNRMNRQQRRAFWSAVKMARKGKKGTAS